MTREQSFEEGFTLPELLVTVGLIVALLGTALVLVRPFDYSARIRDAERWVAISQEMQLLTEYVKDKNGLPGGIPEKPQLIGSEEGMFNLCPVLVPSYQPDLAFDPTEGISVAQMSCLEEGAVFTTGFTISKTADNRVTIAAPAAESGQPISITKKF